MVDLKVDNLVLCSYDFANKNCLLTDGPVREQNLVIALDRSDILTERVRTTTTPLQLNYNLLQ